jgi:GT2 family glycosyltransferase
VSVTVLVVNYRTARLTIEAVRSALAEPEITAAIVVDNASGADDVAALRGLATVTPSVMLIESPTNIGFGAAINRAASRATSTYLFFLNSDAVVARASIAPLIHTLDTDSAIGVAAPYILRPDGELQVDAYGTFPSLRTALQRTHRRPGAGLAPDWVSGVAMLVRRAKFLELGGFDERFFMYLEDVDLCRRYRAHGEASRRVPSASVTHLGAASRTSGKAQASQYRDSLDLYLAKTRYSRPERLLLHVAAGLSSQLHQRRSRMQLGMKTHLAGEIPRQPSAER